MPIAVLAGSPEALTVRSLDIPERQFAVRVVPNAAVGCPWEVHIAAVRLTESKWVVVDTSWEAEVLDLSEEQLVPINRHALLPTNRGGMLTFGVVSEEFMTAIRVRVAQLAELLGGPPTKQLED